MTNTMNWRGYAARVEFDEEDGLFVGHIAGIRDTVGFHADTVDGLRAAFQEAVEDYLETCAATERDPDRAFSGQMLFWVPPEVDRRAARTEELEGKSLSQLAAEVLDRAAG
jgi:predicted HicB family RNase H-like nuclease